MASAHSSRSGSRRSRLARISCAEAQRRELKRYFTGKPCVHGHVAERYVANHRCVVCNQIEKDEWLRTPAGRAYSRAYDKTPARRAQHRQFFASPKGREVLHRYRTSPKGRETHRQNEASFRATPKGIETRFQYRRSPAGKEAERRSNANRDHQKRNERDRERRLDQAIASGDMTRANNIIAGRLKRGLL
jgi:hypothetical protein